MSLFSTMQARALAYDGGFDGGNRISCGTYALYYLLGLEHKRVGLPQIAGVLNTGDERGNSLRELLGAGRSLGLELKAVLIQPTDPFPAGPLIAHLRFSEHGHFVVLRRLGSSGTLVQVLDGIGEPEVREELELRALPEWTGVALVPERPNWLLRIAGTAALVSGLALAAPILLPRLRHKRQGSLSEQPV